MNNFEQEKIRTINKFSGQDTKNTKNLATVVEQSGFRNKSEFAQCDGLPQLRISNGANSHRLRQGVNCVLYTGGQAAEELGVSRQYVHQLRRRLGKQDGLMTSDDVEELKKYRQEGYHATFKSRRESRQEARQRRIALLRERGLLAIFDEHDQPTSPEV